MVQIAGNFPICLLTSKKKPLRVLPPPPPPLDPPLILGIGLHRRVSIGPRLLTISKAHRQGSVPPSGVIK